MIFLDESLMGRPHLGVVQYRPFCPEVELGLGEDSVSRGRTSQQCQMTYHLRIRVTRGYCELDDILRHLRPDIQFILERPQI